LSSKTLIFGRSKHLKNSSKILANTFSDSLAIPKFFFHRNIPGSLPVLITVSELWEWLFPFPSHNSLRERTPLTSDGSARIRIFYKQILKNASGVSVLIFLPTIRLSRPNPGFFPATRILPAHQPFFTQRWTEHDPKKSPIAKWGDVRSPKKCTEQLKTWRHVLEKIIVIFMHNFW